MGKVDTPLPPVHHLNKPQELISNLEITSPLTWGRPKSNRVIDSENDGWRGTQTAALEKEFLDVRVATIDGEKESGAHHLLDVWNPVTNGISTTNLNWVFTQDFCHQQH